MTAAKPRIAVVGAGYWGINLVRVAAECGALAAVCDADETNLARARTVGGGVATTMRFEDLLERGSAVEALVLAVPAPLHASYALAAIAAGKDVFVEKPLALTSWEAEAIVSAAARENRKVFVGHLLLYHPGIVLLLESIARGDIGDVVHVRSRRLSWGKLRNAEDVWWSFAPHDVAVMLAVFGNAVPTGVQAATTARVRAGSADFAYADYRFAGGASAHIEVGWLDVAKSAQLDVFGTNGVLTFNDSRAGATLRLTPAGVRPEAGVPSLWRSPAVELDVPAGEPLKIEFAAFVDWLVTGTQPPTDGAEGLDVVRVLEITHRSANAGTMMSARAAS